MHTQVTTQYYDIYMIQTPNYDEDSLVRFKVSMDNPIAMEIFQCQHCLRKIHSKRNCDNDMKFNQ